MKILGKHSGLLPQTGKFCGVLAQMRSASCYKRAACVSPKDLILQKFETMDADLKVVRSEVKDVRSEMGDRMDKIESKLEDVNAELRNIRDDASQMKVNQAKQAGDLHTLEAKIDGKLETLETKLDGLIENTRERKSDINERWKIGGIVVSCAVAVVSLILSILTRMEE